MRYRRKYHCKRVVALGRKGFNQVEIAVALGVARLTILGWARKHPEFREALEFARDSSLAYWEGKAREAVDQPDSKSINKRTLRKHQALARTNERMWIEQIVRRFPREYGRAVAPDVAQQLIERVIARPSN